ncbi:glycine zipper 2TM domain-containing protein [Qipengyuania qiaonensis]|uniref:17 kDa surface antigen n=1 Tax=Qipengyuania qiaonensis TaxID=2867240 RepID=A0ABS7J860_9SPHN|nr:glycine zipper 2TM domain-containing protein [Qipengyuania qiaonensis]MBX7482254.1 glycine zipper 2TM domain-containing protein [Qipengyuania qiaonensis]
MIDRIALAVTVSSLAVAPGAAHAQETIPYDAGQYEYAQPEPELDDDVVTETVAAQPDATATVQAPQDPAAPVFVANPTIQPIDPSDPAYYADGASPAGPGPAVRTIPARASASGTPTAEPAAGASRIIYRDVQQQAAPTQYVYQSGYVGSPAYLPAGAQVVAFDRDVWLNECRSRLETYESESDRGKIIGALIGGVAGGVLGNRIAGRGNRTAGTLIGAGAGAAAGMAAGDAIDDRSQPRSDSYAQCQAYLDSYMQNATASAGAVQYSQPGAYMLVPVTVEVPQRAVYRDGTPVD